MRDPSPLDDLTHADLMAEARALLPTLAPGWTDHNPSDPGIMLVELLAWLTEMVLYRVDQVPERSTWTFLRLLNAPDWKRPVPGEETDPEALSRAIHATLLELRTPYRAVTCEDFEWLARQWVKTTRDPTPRRIHCLAERDLTGGPPNEVKPGHFSIVVISETIASTPPGTTEQPDATVLSSLWKFLEPRCLLTTVCHVVGPKYVRFSLEATLYLRPEAVAQDVQKKAAEAVQRHLHALHGGADGRGWPLGRSVFVSELLAWLHDQPGVAYVELGDSFRLVLEEEDSHRLLPNKGGVRLQAHELPAVNLSSENFKTKSVADDTWSHS
ncbi:hypothetical protein [Archangium primigenium]|uniref:hypothetical protein n=1 Tax=[Archangium] primigenium TaxID=2792470 RepID=UPI00195CB864|nr:hypothetical protein [Archangium primigenium]MBM7116697.1 baseplate protein J [Archangium primigenium]